jgi:hypothetical protein
MNHQSIEKKNFVKMRLAQPAYFNDFYYCPIQDLSGFAEVFRQKYLPILLKRNWLIYQDKSSLSKIQPKVIL